MLCFLSFKSGSSQASIYYILDWTWSKLSRLYSSSTLESDAVPSSLILPQTFLTFLFWICLEYHHHQVTSSSLFRCSNGHTIPFGQFLHRSGAKILETRSIKSFKKIWARNCVLDFAVQGVFLDLVIAETNFFQHLGVIFSS